MIRFDWTPSSIAVRVTSGRQSIAMRSSFAGRRLIGLPPIRGAGNPMPARRGVQPRSSERKETCMRFGLHVGYWGLGLTADQQADLVKEAEAAGWDSVWAAEAYGS